MKIESVTGRDAGFLSSPKFVAKTVFVEQGSAFAVDGQVYGGMVYPANDATAEGIVFGNYDVTDADALVSVIHTGVINSSRLPEDVISTARAVLTNLVFEDNQY